MPCAPTKMYTIYMEPTSSRSLDTVLYDADCPPCCLFAQFATKSLGGQINFLPWQSLQTAAPGALPAHLAAIDSGTRLKPADRLRALVDGDLLEGEAAWTALVERYTQLTSLGWLAEKMGLTRQAARALDRSGDLLRRLCRRCPK